MSKSRVGWIDCAKGIGILLVVYGHAARGIHDAEIAMDEVRFTFVDSVIHSFHMPLFFALSGIFFAGSWRSRGTVGLVGHKAATLLYPYYVWTLIQGSLVLAASGYTTHTMSPWFPVTALWKPFGHLWFLHALFLVFVVGAVLFSIGRSKAVALTAVVGVGLYALGGLHPGVTPANRICDFLIWFSLGIVVGPMLLADRGRHRWLLAGACVVLFAAAECAYFGLGYGELLYPRLPLGLLGLIGIATVVAVARCMGGRVAAVFAYLGSFSLEIYLMHAMVVSGVRIVLQKVLHQEAAAVHIVAGFGLGVVVPLVVAVVLRRLGWNFLFVMPRFSKVGYQR